MRLDRDFSEFIACCVRLIAALDDFGFGAVGLTTDDLLCTDAVIQLGYPPKRIDLLTSVDGLEATLVLSAV